MSHCKFPRRLAQIRLSDFLSSQYGWWAEAIVVLITEQFSSSLSVHTGLPKSRIRILAAKCGLAALSVLFLITPVSLAADGLGLVRSGFRVPPDNCRILMRWWWFGPAVTNAELERELRAMKDAGIGGVELQPVYPEALDDPLTGLHNVPYLSDKFLDDVRFTAQKARELGLRFDLTLGSGWPYGGPDIPVTQAAGKLRIISTDVPSGTDSIAVPALTTGERLLAAFVNDGPTLSPSAHLLDLAAINNGRLALPSASTERTVTFYISSRTGMMVKRPAFGAEGFVLDHFDQRAIENHLHAVGDRLLTAFGKNPPYAVFSDSLEVYDSDWTGNLLQEFKKRRGYDLTPYLPALTEDIGTQTAEIRHDWGETLTDLINENYLSPIREWARQRGTRFRSQTYGVPAVSLSSYRLVDLPEGESDTWQEFSPSRWASSAGHLYGSTVISAETWTWLHSPAFRATPLDMKADADRFFLEGINQIVGHGWPYSPPGTTEPGWSFYAAGAFNDHNPWWPAMPELTAYLQRISYLLRQGEPSKDVAVLLPTDDAWAQFSPGNDALSEIIERQLGNDVIPQILSAGFNFDFIDGEAIGKIGIPYRALVVPHIERLPLATAELIRKYAESGGIVIATGNLPSKAPGLVNFEPDSPRVRELSQKLFASAGAKGIFVRDQTQLSATLAQELTPDVALSPKVSDLGFVHRVLPQADIYFLANNSNQQASTTATFRTKMLNAEWWDPFTGEDSPAGNSNTIALNLEPYESRVLVFSNGSLPTAKTYTAPTASFKEIPLEKNWTVTIPGVQKPVPWDRLHSWTDDNETHFYSGHAVYEYEFTFSPAAAQQVYLDFGAGVPTPQIDKHARFFAGLDSPVREVAQVYVNERLAGVEWKPPYRVEVTHLLQSGPNRLRIVAYNTAMNEMAGRALPDYRLLDSRYGTRFSPQDTEDIKPLPSGLLGPVRLLWK